MKKEDFNFVPIIAIFIIIFILLFNFGISNTSSNNGQFDCSNYQAELKRIANTPEDLIITHQATGVIKELEISDKYYTVVINPDLWEKTTAEQRQLIRCATTEVANSKGLEGGIVDPVKMERLY
ncbi:unknown [Clostridium sp. CAG:306]|jgi:hypothetical protein|nr:unknown [Clostridium sp. CAG:306]DAZ14370.1 MAG TPA: hypothetical protein [Caudoviricetes sp.]